MTLIRMLNRIQKDLSQYKILILGPDNAGKTSLIHYITKTTTPAIPTFGYRIFNLTHNNHHLTIHDVGGQKEIQKYWHNFYEKIAGIIFVFDIFDNRDNNIILNNVIKMNENNVPLLVMANKSDVCVSDVWVNEEQCDGGKCRLLKCSAVSGENVVEGFDWLVEQIGKNELRV